MQVQSLRTGFIEFLVIIRRGQTPVDIAKKSQSTAVLQIFSDFKNKNTNRELEETDLVINTNGFFVDQGSVHVDVNTLFVSMKIDNDDENFYASYFGLNRK